VLDGLADAADDLAYVVEGEERAQVFLEVFLKIALFAELEDEVVVVGSGEGFVQPHDVRVLDALYYRHFLLDHLLLLCAHCSYLDHLYCVTFELSFFAALKDLARGSGPDLADELVVTNLLQCFSHIINLGNF
jgi:hypothetical protein